MATATARLEARKPTDRATGRRSQWRSERGSGWLFRLSTNEKVDGTKPAGEKRRSPGSLKKAAKKIAIGSGMKRSGARSQRD